MALNRSQAALAVAPRSGRHLVNVGLLATDTSGNMKEPLDDAFMALGVAYADLPAASVEETDLPKFLAVVEVAILNRALIEASGFADVAATEFGVSKKRNQIVQNLERALDKAERAAAPYGVVGITQFMTSGIYRIDGIEPEATA
jgi:hypothetical protein